MKISKTSMCIGLISLGLLIGSLNTYAYCNAKLQNALGDDVFALLSQSKDAKVMAIAPTRKPPYKATSCEKPLSVNELSHLKQLLLNDGSYRFGLKKRCVFVPDTAYVFAGKTPVTIYVSQSCQELKVQTAGKSYYLNYDPIAKAFNHYTNHLV